MSFDITFIPMPELSLLSLPKRLLEHVILFLDFANYFSIRVTCKQLHKASKVYSVSNLAQCYLFDALMTFVPDANGHLDLSHQRDNFLCQFLRSESLELHKWLILDNHISRCLHLQLQSSHKGKISPAVTLIEFLEFMGYMSGSQVRTICILVKSIMAKFTITSLDLSWCNLGTNNATSLIRLMERQGMKLKLHHLNYDCNYITTFACIHRIQDLLDDCALSIQLNKLYKNRCSLSIRGVTQVRAAGNHISAKVPLPKFITNCGHVVRVALDN